MTLFDGITARLVETDRLGVNVLERVGDDPSTSPEHTVVFVHGNVASSLFWQEIMQDLPSELRCDRGRPARVRSYRAQPDRCHGGGSAISATTCTRRSQALGISPPRRAGRWAEPSCCSTRSITPSCH